MGIKGEIESVEIEFLDGDEDIVIKESIGDEKHNQKIVKIIITNAIFVYRQYTDGKNYITVDVIPFSQIKSCSAIIKES